MTAETSNARGEWVLVPRVPTEAMLDAMHSRIRILCDPAERTASIQNDREVWAAMLAGSPPAPVSVPLDRLTALDGLVDRIAEAIRDGAGLAEGDPPWERLGEERRAPWRADAMRVLAVVKESLTAEEVAADAEQWGGDLWNLILMDAEFSMRGSTSLDLPSIQRIEARGWVSEGHENCEYDITDEGRKAIARALSQQAEAQAQGGGEVRAWETEDGRVISARQKETALRDGGASASSVAIYSIPLYTEPPSAPVRAEGFEQWYARVDARFWNNWDACNAAYHAGKRSALAQQPAAAGEEIMVNAAHDVFTLPLQPSGLSSGPRFVVHVPAPEQPAAGAEALSHADLCRLSRVFNAHNVPGLDHDRRINEWLGKRIADALATEHQEPKKSKTKA